MDVHAVYELKNHRQEFRQFVAHFEFCSRQASGS
jgi:hypothetical protein